MKIGFTINDFATEHPRYTTTRIARAAREMGHEAWTIPVGNFSTGPDDQAHANARMSKAKTHKDGDAYLEDLLGDKAHQERIKIADLDVLMLRNRSADDADRTWAQTGAARSNLSSGGKVAQAEINVEMLRLAEIVRPKLERKVRYRDHSQNDNYQRGRIDNRVLATL